MMLTVVFFFGFFVVVLFFFLMLHKTYKVPVAIHKYCIHRGLRGDCPLDREYKHTLRRKNRKNKK